MTPKRPHPPFPARGIRKTPTGIQGFDEITLGGLPTGRPTLVCGAAGSGKTLFGIEFLVRGATTYNCENHLAGGYEVEVIDLLENPKLATADQILAIPTLVRKLPEPERKIIGDLSDEQRVLVGLDVRPNE